ncbi:GLPGLI family protein [Pseudoflavitalea sp. G-6-1-2]|uniref:GLPGLI family protein n=1 Tax=Pseudoflavitalea sp. G-6-1-2 TaxID=2728841 RepID=UPI00146E8767|nr:GLPGLI family protein [Pseudoflavitalea sp. G-6-1-2]NML22224.1 GLPGLI family protein [Pseudoflavitalea sp. G-6-1-2]
MKIFLFIILSLTCFAGAQAQRFIQHGTITYEQRVSQKKLMQAEDPTISKEMLDATSESFIINNRLIFSGNKTLYTGMPGQEEFMLMIMKSRVWSDLETRKAVFKTNSMHFKGIYEDSLLKMRWQIQNETRNIAGFKCRKAIGTMLDSVVVVAFYCPEIVPQGGPEIFSGLPGMILGIAIPRFYTTWFATKVEVGEPGAEVFNIPFEKGEKIVPIEEFRKDWRKTHDQKKKMPDDHVNIIIKGMQYQLPSSMKEF